MVTILFKGKSPWQLFDAVCWRVRILIRRSFLSVLRRLYFRSEENWIRSQPQVRFPLTPDEAKAILKSDAGAESAIFSEAAGVLSGWTEVPGFGQREIRLEARDLHKPEEAYARRLLCRLDFLRPLVRASFIAADKSAYINAVEMHLFNWHEVRQRSSRWDSVDEAIRVLNLIETLSLLQGTLTAEARAAGLRSLTTAAWLIQADRTRTGNHLIYEGLALFYAGVCLPTHYRARAWLKLGHRILEKAMQQQVYNDGMNGELSTNYHLITGTNFLKAWVLGKKFGFDFSEAFQEKLAKMAAVASLLRSDDGGFLALGDTDRMAGSSREETEAKAFAELGEILRGEGRKKGYSPELRLLLAGFDSDFFGNEEIARKEQLYSAGGYRIHRDNRGRTLIFDTGLFGFPGLSHHGHADSLSFEVHLPEMRFLVDPGGFSYVDEEARAFARSTIAHNTIRIDWENSSQILGSFGFGRGAQAKPTGLFRFDGGFVLSAEHDGYARLPSPVIHRRGLVWFTDRPFLFLVVDWLEGKGRHTVEAFFHADEGWEAQPESQNQVIWCKNQYRIVQAISADEPVNTSIHQGELEPEWQGWVAPALGKYRPAPTLVEECQSDLPLNIVNVFYEPGKSTADVQVNNSNYSVNIGHDLKLYWRWEGSHLTVNLK